MPRAVAILKYFPAVLCGLLVLTWMVNFVAWFGVVMHVHDRELHATANAGCLVYVNMKFKPQPFSVRFVFARHEQDSRYEPLGKLQIVIGDESNLGAGSMYVLFPIPLAVTLLGVAAIGPFLRFRFPLWSYFAWTALVAAELAYYLR